MFEKEAQRWRKEEGAEVNSASSKKKEIALLEIRGQIKGIQCYINALREVDMVAFELSGSFFHHLYAAHSAAHVPTLVMVFSSLMVPQG